MNPTGRPSAVLPAGSARPPRGPEGRSRAKPFVTTRHSRLARFFNQPGRYRNPRRRKKSAPGRRAKIRDPARIYRIWPRSKGNRHSLSVPPCRITRVILASGSMPSMGNQKVESAT